MTVAFFSHFSTFSQKRTLAYSSSQNENNENEMIQPQTNTDQNAINVLFNFGDSTKSISSLILTLVTLFKLMSSPCGKPHKLSFMKINLKEYR